MTDKPTFSGGRRLAIGLNVLVASLLAPVAGGLLLYLSFRPELRRRFDWTARAAFTLAERTLRVLGDLDEPVDVYTCFQPVPYNESGTFSPGMEAVIQTIGLHCNDLLREFELRSRGKLRAHVYDPNFTGHLARISELRTLLGEPALNVVVVAKGERKRVLRLPDLAAYDAGTQTSQALTRPTLHGFRDEEALAKAILSVTEEREVKVGFLRGHGERDPGAGGDDSSGRPGFAGWAVGLSAQNYALRSLDLSEAKAIPKDEVDVLVIADPVKPLADGEVEAIVRFAREGGKLLVLLGPSAANTLDFPLLSEVLGLSRRPHPVCQVTTVGDWKSRANAFFTETFSEHAIVKPLRSRGLRMAWRDACALAPTGRPDQAGILPAPLVWTGSEAWEDLPGENRQYNFEFDPGVEEAKRPYVLAYAVTRTDGEGNELGRAVVAGCSAVLDNRTLQTAPNNRDFGLNAIDWLAEREQLIALAPRPFDVVQVDLTARESNAIFLYVVAGVPAIALLLGVAVFWLRRN
jgi:hypothetical protein